jgi:hypothetical protein
MMAIVFELLEELPRMGPGSQQQTKRSEINRSSASSPPSHSLVCDFLQNKP